VLQINLLGQKMNLHKKNLRSQFYGAISSAFFLLLLSAVFAVLSCSPSHPEKKIRGKNVTQTFFFKHSGEYQNGSNKRIRFANNENLDNTTYEQEIAFTETQYALKIDLDFKIFNSNDNRYSNDKKFQIKFECASNLIYKVNRVEEIPKEQSVDDISSDLKAIKNNPIPLKYLIYLEGIQSKHHKLVKIIDTAQNTLAPQEQTQLEAAAENYCADSFQNRFPSENRGTEYGHFNNENYLALTEISENGFVMLKRNQVNSQLPSAYKPDNYESQSKFSILKDIEFFPSAQAKKTIPLGETNYVQGKLPTPSDFLTGKYTERTSGHSPSLFYFDNKDAAILFKVEKKDYSCQQDFQFDVLIQNLDLVNHKNKSASIAEKHKSDNYYSEYLDADLISQSVLNQVALKNSSATSESCQLYKKFDSLKNQNATLTFAFQYRYSNRYLSILMLDAQMNVVEYFTAVGTEPN
jgi:hypothetical protein